MGMDITSTTVNISVTGSGSDANTDTSWRHWRPGFCNWLCRQRGLRWHRVALRGRWHAQRGEAIVCRGRVGEYGGILVCAFPRHVVCTAARHACMMHAIRS